MSQQLLTAEDLAELRAVAESGMTDDCTIGHPTGEPVYNRVTKQYETPLAEVYAGKCSLRRASDASVEIHAADQAVQVNRIVVSVPADTTGVNDEDVVTITASTHSPQLVNAQFRVRSVLPHSLPTALRLECEEA